ncbi:MAG: ferrochelatase [Planctomycetaceae bacterium]|jgi:ferrochelatase|nr:ferrochelatase [Planctomycetaceae bacterium]
MKSHLSKTFLLISYGAPEVKEDVIPFLNNLLANNVDSAILSNRVAAAAEKYYNMERQTGKLSPLNKECQNLIAGIFRETKQHDNISLNIYWGNLFWHPLLEDTVAKMTNEGIKQAICLTTSMFDSGKSSKRYANALEKAKQKIGSAAPIFEMLPLFFDHPLFIEAQVDRLLEILEPMIPNKKLTPEMANSILVLFSAHSIPKSDLGCSNYVAQLRQTCLSIIEQCSMPTLSWELVFQSQSGIMEHWLQPDIKERVREIAATGQYQSIVVLPIGFFCENMETVHDLDLEIGELCCQSGLEFHRAKTVGTLPKICKMIAAEIIKQK